MPYVVTLEDFRPSPRYDSLPWTQARIEEGTTSEGPWTILETKNLSPVDADPANPAYRNFTTELGTAPDLWYRVVFLDVTGDLGLPTFAVQNSETGRPIYATTTELALLLRVNENQRHAALRRVLEMASTEIDSEIGTADVNGVSTPYGAPPALVTGVCIDRAVEHWKQMQAPFGLLNLGDLADQVTQRTARDSWDRHAYKLAPLKGEWGIA
jgi:hypothetical protein